MTFDTRRSEPPIELTGVRVNRGGRCVLNAPSLRIASSGVTAILGPNGSGKSTLMNVMARQVRPDSGAVSMGPHDLNNLRQNELAQAIAYLPQRLPPVAGLTVRELVLLGRFAWRGAFGSWREIDRQTVDSAMRLTDVSAFAETFVDHLSGGERHRAWISMLLAQEAPLLLLDEPTAALDLAHQHDLMRLVRALHQEHGKGFVMVLHDVNLALQYADRIIALKNGELAFDGPAPEFAEEATISSLYGVEVDFVQHPRLDHRIAVVSSG